MPFSQSPAMSSSSAKARLVHGVDHKKVTMQHEALLPFVAAASRGDPLDLDHFARAVFRNSYLWFDCEERDREGAPGLVAALKQLGQREAAHFIATALPLMLNAVQTFVLLDDSQPPLSVVEIGKPDTRHFTRYECFQILSAAFFCQFPRRSDNCVAADDRELPSINLDELYRSGGGSVEREKLVMFIDYFVAMSQRVASRDDSIWSEKLTILRRQCDGEVAGKILTKDVPLGAAVMHGLGESIDDQHDMLRVDFANKLIGGASLAYGCVQEEITFSVCPELNVARLYHAPMGENEAIVLLNAMQFSTLKKGTYGFSLQHGGPCTRPHVPNGIIALDALDLRMFPGSMQYTSAGVDRELMKCLAGFSFDGREVGLSDQVSGRVATGNWGCGVFRGDAELKLLIQWVACSLTGREMHYFPFDRQDLVRAFPSFERAMRSKGVTALTLLQVLRTKLAQFSPRSDSVWNVVAHQLLG